MGKHHRPLATKSRSRGNPTAASVQSLPELTDCVESQCHMVINHYECPCSCEWLGSPCSNSRVVRQAQIAANSKKVRVRTCPKLRWQLHLETIPGQFIAEDTYVGLYIGGIRDTLRRAFSMNMDHTSVSEKLPELKSDYIMNIEDKHHRFSVDGASGGNHTAFIQNGGKDSNLTFVKGVSMEGYYAVWVKTRWEVGDEKNPVALTVDYGPDYGKANHVILTEPNLGSGDVP